MSGDNGRGQLDVDEILETSRGWLKGVLKIIIAILIGAAGAILAARFLELDPVAAARRDHDAAFAFKDASDRYRVNLQIYAGQQKTSSTKLSDALVYGLSNDTVLSAKGEVDSSFENYQGTITNFTIFSTRAASDIGHPEIAGALEKYTHLLLVAAAHDHDCLHRRVGEFIAARRDGRVTDENPKLVLCEDMTGAAGYYPLYNSADEDDASTELRAIDSCESGLGELLDRMAKEHLAEVEDQERWAGGLSLFARLRVALGIDRPPVSDARTFWSGLLPRLDHQWCPNGVTVRPRFVDMDSVRLRPLASEVLSPSEEPSQQPFKPQPVPPPLPVEPMPQSPPSFWDRLFGRTPAPGSSSRPSENPADQSSDR